MRPSRAAALAAAFVLCACGFGGADAIAGSSKHAPTRTSARAGNSGLTASTPATSTPQPSPDADTPPPLAKDTKAVAKLRKRLNGDINAQGGKNSALVVDESTGKTLWAYNAATTRLPASVEKLFTTTTALIKLGRGWRAQTRVLGAGVLQADGTFKGDLYLKGGGDPTFGSSHFDHLQYRTGATVQLLVARLKAAGVKRINGAIIADASLFDSRGGGPATGYRSSLETEGELSALAFNAGFTNIYEEQLQKHPALYAADQFVSAMRAKGIVVPKSTKVLTGHASASARELAAVDSPELASLLELTNSPSDNFFAEMLLKQLGARFGGKGSTPAGAAVVRAVIADHFDLHPRLDDGSGLARYDHTTADQVVYLLRRMQDSSAFWNSLAIAGVRGTMQHEMLGTPAAHNCRGKTGTLRDVANLVGYCTAANGNKLVFAFLMNGLSDADAGHQLEDLAGAALAEYKG